MFISSQGWKVYKLNVGCLSDAKQVVSLRHNQCDGDETCSYDNLLPGWVCPTMEWNYNIRPIWELSDSPINQSEGLGLRSLNRKSAPSLNRPCLFMVGLIGYTGCLWKFTVGPSDTVSMCKVVERDECICSLFLFWFFCLDKTTWHDWFSLCEASMIVKKVKCFWVDVSVSKMLTM